MKVKKLISVIISYFKKKSKTFYNLKRLFDR